MDFEWDGEGIKYFFKFLGLTAVVLVVGVWVAKGGGEFYLAYEYEKLPQVAVPEKLGLAKTPEPKYEELSLADKVFAAPEEILKKKEELIAGSSDFIFADLAEMKLYIYKEGILEGDPVEILAKGREGSFFETPSGIYKVESRERRHFSTIGKVWMPWSMHFFGNYFIHGWPYYPSGKAVETTYSGGCIRLSDVDAKKVYEAAENGTHVLIYREKGNENAMLASAASAFQDAFFKKVAVGKKAPSPKITAEAALAADFETGQILFSKNEDLPFPIASVTKLMTALVASDSFHGRTFRLGKEELKEYGNYGNLKEGELFEAKDLLYPLLLSSSNDAAKAYELGLWNFVELMNKKAEALGMSATYFKDASGLSPENISSAEDIFKLLKYVYEARRPIFDITSFPEYHLTSINKKAKHVWRNINWDMKDARFLGGKTGHTDEALYAMAGVYNVKLSESASRPVAIIVLRSLGREEDIKNIIKYLEENFVYGSVFAEREPMQDLKEPPQPLTVFNEASVYEAVERLAE